METAKENFAKVTNIETELKKKGIKILFNQDEMKKQIFGLDIDTLNKLKPCLEGIGKSVEKFKSDDPIDNIVGVLNLVAGVTTMIPGVGPLVCAMFTMVASIVSAFGDTSKATVYDTVLKALDKYDDEQRKRAAAGVVEKLISHQHFLTGFLKTNDYKEKEVKRLSTLCFVGIATEFLAELWHDILRYSVNKSSKDASEVKFQATRAVDYTEAFCKLLELRKDVLIEYYCILMSVGGFVNLANGILENISDCEDKEKELAELMSKRYTNVENAAFMSVFHKSERPCTSALLDKYNRSIPAINLDSAVMKMQNKGSTYNARLHSEDQVQGEDQFTVLRLGCAQNNYTVFTFVKIKEEDNIFHIISEDCFDNGIVEHDFISADEKSDKPLYVDRYSGKHSEWKIIQIEKGGVPFYLIGSMKHPTMFMYMHFRWWTKDIAGIKTGDPGPLGYWQFMRR